MTASSALEAEIREQPEVIARLGGSSTAAVRQAAALLTGRDVTHVVFGARGSSDNAARFAQYLLGQRLGLSGYLAAPSLFQAGSPPRLAGAAVVGISQSGQSPDIVGVLDAARRQGRPTVAITNDDGSPLARTADVTVSLGAGPEASVAATKTYTATLAMIAQIAVAAGASDLRKDLARLPDLMAKVVGSALARTDGVLALPSAAGPQTLLLTAVGRGTGYATAAETALKIREVSAARAEAYPVPDLLHGPIAANTEGSALWVVASPSYQPEYWNAVTSRLSAEGVSITVLVPGRSTEITADRLLVLPERVPGWVFDILAVAYGQVAALRLGERSGLDVDAPRGLSKVTRTR